MCCTPHVPLLFLSTGLHVVILNCVLCLGSLPLDMHLGKKKCLRYANANVDVHQPRSCRHPHCMQAMITSLPGLLCVQALFVDETYNYYSLLTIE